MLQFLIFLVVLSLFFLEMSSYENLLYIETFIELSYSNTLLNF